MKVMLSRNVFYVISYYSEKDIIKSCDFKWNSITKRWETTDMKAVEKLLSMIEKIGGIHFVSPDVRRELGRKAERLAEVMEKSISSSSNIEIPAPEGLRYMPFQKACVEFINSQRNVLIADEMGLGKTIEIMGYINMNPQIKHVLVICPAFLRDNWKQEFNKWMVRKYDIKILDNKGIGDITITNYESVKKYFNVLKSQIWDVLVLDESHYIKNYNAQRTKYITGFYVKDDKENKTWFKGLKDYTRQKILLTGTPIMNKPMELYTQLKVLGSEIANSKHEFYNKYVVFNNWKNDALHELQLRLRVSCMIRREKKDVLLELPEKTTQLIKLPSNILSTEELEKSKVAIEYISENWDNLSNSLKTSKVNFSTLGEIAKMRHQQSIKKIPYVISMIENILENEQKVVVFAHHHDVINAIYEKFKDISVIATGEQSFDERSNAVNQFQNNQNVRVFIGSIQAMGVGITLTASSVVVFAEIEWRPSDLYQAEDRLHRIGQKSAVLVYYILIDNSIDAYMASKIAGKTEIIQDTTNKDKINL